MRALELVGLGFENSLSLAAALLSIPGFVERLCKLATRKVSESTGTASFLQELEEWYTWLDNALVLDALMRVANEESEHNQGTSGLGAGGGGEGGGVAVAGRVFYDVGAFP